MATQTRMRLFAIRLAVAVLLAASTPSARAAEAPFEAGLLRLSEVLGSLHFLKTLCGDPANGWRGEMERLLAAENPDPARRARLVASFNRGYRAFSSTYSTCTASAEAAISRYTQEGETLARDIATRYGD